MVPPDVFGTIGRLRLILIPWPASSAQVNAPKVSCFGFQRSYPLHVAARAGDLMLGDAINQALTLWGMLGASGNVVFVPNSWAILEVGACFPSVKSSGRLGLLVLMYGN